MSGNSLVPVDLPDGGELLVPLGEEEVMHPSGDGRSYRIKWAQDDEGRLVVLDCSLAQAPQQHHQQHQQWQQQQNQQQQVLTMSPAGPVAGSQ